MNRTCRLAALTVCCAVWSGCHAPARQHRRPTTVRSRPGAVVVTDRPCASGDDCSDRDARSRRPRRPRRSGGAPAQVDERPTSPTEQ